MKGHRIVSQVPAADGPVIRGVLHMAPVERGKRDGVLQQDVTFGPADGLQGKGIALYLVS